MRDWAVLPLRICLGVVFAAHGLQKAFGLWGSGGIKEFSEMLSGLGFFAPTFLAYLVAYLELLGGICIIVGIFVRISSALLLVTMVVAMIKVHLEKGFFMMQGGYEYNFTLICMCLSMLISGGGVFSVNEDL